MSSGSPVRICREASSTTAPTIANASCGEASRGAAAALGVLAVDLVDVGGVLGEHAVAPLDRARAGADDLDQQRLRLVGERGEHLEERADHRAHAAGGVAAAVLLAGPAHRLEHGLRGGVVERDDAVLLVVEVLVERRLRHARLARDRLGRRVGVADAARTPRRRGRVETPALAVLADLQRRRVAARAVPCRAPDRA